MAHITVVMHIDAELRIADTGQLEVVVEVPLLAEREPDGRLALRGMRSPGPSSEAVIVLDQEDLVRVARALPGDSLT